MIRRAKVGDVDAVRSIGERTWRHAYAEILTGEEIERGLAEWWSAEQVERSIRDGITLVAEEDGEVIGMIGLGEKDGAWVMWKLYVLPVHQGKGLGRALIAEGIEALPPGTDELWLDVLENNEPAIAFYRSQGFTERRREKPFIWMAKPLTSGAVEG